MGAVGLLGICLSCEVHVRSAGMITVFGVVCLGVCGFCGVQVGAGDLAVAPSLAKSARHWLCCAGEAVLLFWPLLSD